ncbi:MAG: bifunctional pyr operon transcriptional regulator/uracil phosphoribosyltransferase PyrR [Candidatus Hydrothermia bacterium]|nr:bifunctional pyr operon transcriptional regulator/uracil phosphoribosyltransferase PyrR [Candidatus Hydrothermia bacterium]
MINEKYKLMTEEDMDRTLKRISREIIEKVRDLESLIIVGIKTRGVPLAKTIKDEILKITGVDVPLGAVDITFYRDDLSMVGEKPQVKGTELPFSVEGKNIILIDDVLYTGRTTRAAMEELIDYGRPASIKLCVLVERGHRELPICPDFVGKSITTTKNEIVKVKVKEVDGVNEVVVCEQRDNGTNF